MGQNNNVDMVFRPSWKNYIFQYLIIAAMAVVVCIIAFSSLTGVWKNYFYIACVINIVLIIIKILLDKFYNKTEWKDYIVQYLFIFAIIVIMGIVAFAPLSAVMKKYLCIAGLIYILAVFSEVTLCRFSERLAIREDKVYMELGVLRKQYTQIGIHQVRTTQVTQDLWQRLVNIGNLEIASSGTDSYEIIAHGINNPHEIREKIRSYQASAKKE